MYYDPMIAKLITYGPTREDAINAQAAALDAFYIDGIQHNIPFLSALMQHPRWRSGDLSTAFIAEEFEGGFKHREPEGEARDILAVAATIDNLTNVRRRHISGQLAGRRGPQARRDAGVPPWQVRAAPARVGRTQRRGDRGRCASLTAPSAAR